MNYLDIDISMHMKVEEFIEGRCVSYKGFPIWKTGVGLDKLEFRVYDPVGASCDNPNYYFLICEDYLGDKFYYGKFYDKYQLGDFLDNPFDYHDKESFVYQMLFNE